MAADTPVVASDIPGYAKVATPDRAATPAAVLVEPGDVGGARPPRLRRGARASPDGPQRCVPPGRERSAGFDLERLCDLYLEIYQQVQVDRPVAVG